MKMRRMGVPWILIVMLGPNLLAGCAASERKKAAKTENFLIAAGFTEKKPITPQEQASLQSMKPLKMLKTTRQGKVMYVYPDPYDCKCVYVGNEQQYLEFRRLGIESNIAAANLAAAEMKQYGPPYDLDWWWW